MAKTYGTVTTFTAGSVLTAAQLNTAGTNITNLVTPATVSVYNTGNQSLTTGTITRLSWTTSKWDTDTMKGAGTVTGISINTTGIYMITAFQVFDTNATGVRELLLDIGTAATTTSIIGGVHTPVGDGNYGNVTLSVMASLTAGNTIQLFGYQTSGGALNVLGSATRALTLTWIGLTA